MKTAIVVYIIIFTVCVLEAYFYTKEIE